MGERHVTIPEIGSWQALNLPYVAVGPPTGTGTVPLPAEYNAGVRGLK